jgi:hypothetical protein
MSDIIQEPLSDLLVDAIETARRHGGVLVRRAVFRGSWTWLGCPAEKGSTRPSWYVTDTTVHALLKRGCAVKTHTREGDRPAAVRVKSEKEMPLGLQSQLVDLNDRAPTADEERGMRWWNSQTDIGRSYYLARCDSPAAAWARYKQAVADRVRRTA